MRRAFAAKGVHLSLFPLRPLLAQLSSSPCPIFIVFDIGKTANLQDGCPGSSIAVGRIRIGYTPLSAGTTIRQAVAALR